MELGARLGTGMGLPLAGSRLPPPVVLALPVPQLSGQLSCTCSLILLHPLQRHDAHGFLCCLPSSRCAFLYMATVHISSGPSIHLAHLS